ncbi:hypothetical protein [Legionella fallonii]|uniref:Uncharacterized protein n=1 Tax=Legionella fallonii LLAP-10 TaxID=1212491 RepID=A0A098G3I0_9GAMM|nr:hypothetical protein [Legionella fallonii]CEG56531.1 protein of unknown function [Legionella fallonii LLAP-10]
MQLKSESKSGQLSKTVELAIETVNKRHYLGASNHGTNPTGGLNGYYRNIAMRVYNTFRNAKGEFNPLFYVYIMDACVSHTGAGNCGELSAALYLELILSDLSLAQKKLVQLRSYPTKDAHVENSYVLVDSTVYDIWASKKYKQSRIKAETHVADKYHQVDPGINLTVAQASIRGLKESVLAKFSKLFDEEIAKERLMGNMYVTFDSKDPSDNALWASEALPYLFNKFQETVCDSYFLAHMSEAEIIQGKIIKDFIYLIEELRQDFPSSGLLNYPGKIQYSHEEIAGELKKLISNQLFIDFILAISYRNSNPQKSLELLIKLQSTWSPNSIDKLELSVMSTVSTMIVGLKSNLTIPSQNTVAPCSTTIESDATDDDNTKDVKNTEVDKSQKREEELNPHSFFVEAPKKNDKTLRGVTEDDGNILTL